MTIQGIQMNRIMTHSRPFPSTYENAYRLIAAARKVAKSYRYIHFWEHPAEYVEYSVAAKTLLVVIAFKIQNCFFFQISPLFRKTFNARLCKELGLPPTAKSVCQILIIVNEWNIHQILKGIFKGTITYISPTRKRQMIK